MFTLLILRLNAGIERVDDGSLIRRTREIREKRIKETFQVVNSLLSGSASFISEK